MTVFTAESIAHCSPLVEASSTLPPTAVGIEPPLPSLSRPQSASFDGYRFSDTWLLYWLHGFSVSCSWRCVVVFYFPLFFLCLLACFIPCYFLIKKKKNSVFTLLFILNIFEQLFPQCYTFDMCILSNKILTLPVWENTYMWRKQWALRHGNNQPVSEFCWNILHLPRLIRRLSFWISTFRCNALFSLKDINKLSLERPHATEA